jgi:hypothetical protein
VWDPFKRTWEDLAVDLVYSEGQRKRFRLPPPPDWVVSKETVVPLYVGGPSVRTVFYVHPSLPSRVDHVLRHLAGVAELRYRLLAPKEAWSVDNDPVHFTPTPDAVLFSKGERIAVEYDAGYPLPIAKSKLLAMGEKYPKQVWGVVTEERKGVLTALIPSRLRERVEVLVAPWF